MNIRIRDGERGAEWKQQGSGAECEVPAHEPADVVYVTQDRNPWLMSHLSRLAFNPRVDGTFGGLLHRSLSICLEIPSVTAITFDSTLRAVHLPVQVRKQHRSATGALSRAKCVCGRRTWGTLTVRASLPDRTVQRLSELLAQQIAMSLRHLELVKTKQELVAAITSSRIELSRRKLTHRAIGSLAAQWQMSFFEAESVIRREADASQAPFATVAEQLLRTAGSELAHKPVVQWLGRV